MHQDDHEEKLLRSVAFQNAQAVLLARERAERELISAKEALERKSAELAESNERATNILESITDAFLVLDKEWRFTYVNPRAEQILAPLHKSRRTLLGKNYWSEFPDLVGTPLEKYFRQVVSERVKVEFENFYPPLNAWFEVRAYPARDGISIYFLDITGRKRAAEVQQEADEQLRRSEEELRALANSIPQLAWMAHPDGHIFWYNRGWYDYTGATPDQMEGWGWKSAHDPMTLPIVIEKWNDSIRTGTPFEMEFPLRAADGAFHWFLTRVRPVRNQEGQITRWFGTNTNIDEQRQLLQSLRDAHDQLEKRVNERTAELKTANQNLRELSARLLQLRDEEQRRLARELHDSVGQLLAAIGMNISSVQDEAHKLSPLVAQCVADNANLLEEVTRQIRTISYLLHPPLLDEAGLASALRWYTEGFAERSKIKVDLEIPADFARLSSDAEIAIFRVVQECLTNIHRHAESDTAKIRIRREGDRVCVLVQDTGKGISREKQSELSSSRRAGVGIGGMRERLRQLGGTLDIKSNKDGTTVSAVLRLE